MVENLKSEGANNAIPFYKGIVLSFFKALNQKDTASKGNLFIMWGSLDYLRVDLIESLSHFHFTDEMNIVKELGLSPPMELKHLYIYKDADTELNFDQKNEQDVDWIFQNHKEYPLLVVVLVNSENFEEIKSRVEDKKCSNPLYFDIFKTLGLGTAVVVFRSQKYEHVLECILSINEFCQNTYSIAGVQDFFSKRANAQDQKELTYKNLLGITGKSKETDIAFVSINYTLNDRDNEIVRVDDFVKSILSIKKGFFDDFGVSENDITIETYYEIGKYDIEVEIKGSLPHILELLLSLDYGLVNVESQFYRKFVFESRTFWKKPIPSSEE